MDREEYKELFDDFEARCPWAAKMVRKCWLSDYMELTAELTDGSAIKYDGVLQAFRWAASLDELTAIINPQSEAAWRQQFGLRLWRMLLIKGMSQLDLSIDTDISTGSIAQYTNGNVTPNTYNVIKIAKTLGCTPEEFAHLVLYN